MDNIMNIEKQINDAVKDLPSNDYLLGRGLNQPFNPANSGSRKLMYAVHSEHRLLLNNGEQPIIQTGFENEFGRNSSSFKEAQSNYKVIYKIPKFEFAPNLHYYLIIQDLTDGKYDVVERVQYKHTTESYGYLYNNKYIDSLNVGDIIHKGDVIKKSNGFDDYNNRLDGVNLTTLYLSCDQNMEDSIVISESASKKLESTLVHVFSTTINDNDVLLNLYGNDNVYKAFPDIGEHIKDGIFCGVRRLENECVLYSLSQAKLRDIFMSDKKLVLDGVVADIDVYCNNPDNLKESYYNQQLYFYYDQRIRFCKKINDLVGSLSMQGELTYDLQKLYSICRDTIGGKKFYKDKEFNNVILQVTILENLEMNNGDKMADRYGGKGVVSKVVPDDMMPLLDNGTRVDVIKNQSTCINRQNLGQLNELSLTFMGSRILDYFRMGVLTYSEMVDIWYDFVSSINKEQADSIMLAIDKYDQEQCKGFIDSILEDDAIMLSLLPFTQNLTLDDLDRIHKKFSWIKPYKVKVPIEDSNGNIRFVNTRRNLIVGKIYNYRLKQYAEEKFSVTSLSATNLKNLNTRSKANKLYETKFTKTPIMFGPMESSNMAHLGMEYVIMNLMLYSSSPQGRRMFEKLLTGDPYNIDIKLDADAKNRNAEIINTIFKAMGLRLVFKKVPKVKKFLFDNIMMADVPNKDFKYKTNVREVMKYKKDEIQTKRAVAMKTPGKQMFLTQMVEDLSEKKDKNESKK